MFTRMSGLYLFSHTRMVYGSVLTKIISNVDHEAARCAIEARYLEILVLIARQRVKVLHHWDNILW